VGPINLLPTLGQVLEALKEVIERVEEYNRGGWHVLVGTLDLKNAFNMAWPTYLDERIGSDGVPGGLREMA